MRDIGNWGFCDQFEKLRRGKIKILRSDIAISPIENGKPNSTKS